MELPGNFTVCYLYTDQDQMTTNKSFKDVVLTQMGSNKTELHVGGTGGMNI
jgi:hypothetical protein